MVFIDAQDFLMDRAQQCLKFTEGNMLQYLIAWDTFYLGRTFVLSAFLGSFHRF